ncbi:hypothetical protein PPL_03678 [Heterostelium album PN500]|uniref:Profilin n=1 Tax=Heterostelium pallidum (strain ATCC 26659 / Pp 5 / PN500) TaxID=670386 RepID=D3B6D0_HETP5|nr:hypothetical protein PPL_03678 [Heterostelium album PN500]EFA82900.1 hypothetical protein PPL_03678 [Heterostelium album PN500]|eukprot:XP_020435017.1 hypothetical protein PPL_03678 [Heterostelium album PN500]
MTVDMLMGIPNCFVRSVLLMNDGDDGNTYDVTKMIKMNKEKIIKDFLGNELFAHVMVIGLDGKVLAYNKSPLQGEIEQLLNGLKKPKNQSSIKLIGEKYDICIRENTKIYAHGDTKSCIIARSKKAYIIGIFPKRLELCPRVNYLEQYCETFDKQEYVMDTSFKIVM